MKTTIDLKEEDRRILKELKEKMGIDENIYIIRAALRALLRRIRAAETAQSD